MKAKLLRAVRKRVWIEKRNKKYRLSKRINPFGIVSPFARIFNYTEKYPWASEEVVFEMYRFIVVDLARKNFKEQAKEIYQ